MKITGLLFIAVAALYLWALRYSVNVGFKTQVLRDGGLHMFLIAIIAYFGISMLLSKSEP